MLSLAIEPWQVPVFAMAALALPPALHWLYQWVRNRSTPAAPDPAQPAPEQRATSERLRTTILATLTVALVGVFVVALGTENASVLTSAASAVSALVSAVMTVQSYLTLLRIRDASHGGQSSDPADPQPVPPGSGGDPAGSRRHRR